MRDIQAVSGKIVVHNASDELQPKENLCKHHAQHLEGHDYLQDLFIY
jgi:hypothetical protein